MTVEIRYVGDTNDAGLYSLHASGGDAWKLHVALLAVWSALYLIFSCIGTIFSVRIPNFE